MSSYLKKQAAKKATATPSGRTVTLKSGQVLTGSAAANYGKSSASNIDTGPVTSVIGTETITTNDSLSPITPASLIPEKVIDVPVVPGATNTGLNAMTTIGATTPTAYDDLFKSLTTQYVQPESSADIYSKAEQEVGLQQKQQLVNTRTAELNAIVAKSQADQLRVVGQGRGIPEVIIGGQQAQIAREAAIQALPVAAQLSAAQGDLEAAQSHLDTLFKLRSEDAKNTADFQNKLVDRVWQYATDQQKEQLADLRQQKQNDFTLKTKDIEYARGLASFATENGAPGLASQIMGLDHNSPTYSQDIARLAAKLPPDLLRQASIANTYSQINERNAKSTSLGGTLNGKPQTAGQATIQGYAERTFEANKIITAVGSQFTGIASYIGQTLPNPFKSSDRQQYEQAQRNFVNAVLRRESGAVISDQEFANARQQYFPQPGDQTEVVAQKEANRSTVINNLYLGANKSRPAEPGSIIEDGTGQQYVVGADGETLEPL